MNNTSGIPFWGKQKPLRHYFKNGLIKFNVRCNELFFTLVVINKKGHFPIDTSKVNDKEHLDRLLKIKSIEEV